MKNYKIQDSEYVKESISYVDFPNGKPDKQFLDFLRYKADQKRPKLSTPFIGPGGPPFLISDLIGEVESGSERGKEIYRSLVINNRAEFEKYKNRCLDARNARRIKRKS